MKVATSVLSALLLAGSPPAVPAGGEDRMNALLVLRSDKAAFDADFQKYLADNGARILRAFPPHAFMGYVPAALDRPLGDRYGAKVYRSRIEDMAGLVRYGEKAFYAATEWNKYCQEDPPEAPLVVSHKVLRTKKGGAIVLSWNEMMKATGYRLEIGRDAKFGYVVHRAAPRDNRYEVYPAFFEDGVYYWRVSGLLTLNTGERAESRFSEVFSFAVSRPAGAGPLPAPKLPASMPAKGGRPLAWEKEPAFRYYRVQLGGDRDFRDMIAEEFTDKNYLATSGLPLEAGATYYLRLMGGDNSAAGPWSAACAVRMEGEAH